MATNAERKRAFDARMLAGGFVRVSGWTTPEKKIKILKLLVGAPKK